MWLAATRSSSLGGGGATGVGCGCTRAGTVAGGSYLFGSTSASGGDVSDEQPATSETAAINARERNVRSWRMRRRSYVHREGQASYLEARHEPATMLCCLGPPHSRPENDETTSS